MTTTEDETPTGGPATIDRLEQLLDEWRGRIDDLLVQADLASKDVSETVRSRCRRGAERVPGGQEPAATDPEGRRGQPRLAAGRRGEAHRRPAPRLRVGRGGPATGSRPVAEAAADRWRTTVGRASGHPDETVERDLLATARGGARLRGGPRGPAGPVPGTAGRRAAPAPRHGQAHGARARGIPGGRCRLWPISWPTTPHSSGWPGGAVSRPIRPASTSPSGAGPNSRRHCWPWGSTCPGGRNGTRATVPTDPGHAPADLDVRCRWRRCGARARRARGSGWRRTRPGCVAPCPTW